MCVCVCVTSLDKHDVAVLTQLGELLVVPGDVTGGQNSLHGLQDTHGLRLKHGVQDTVQDTGYST